MKTASTSPPSRADMVKAMGDKQPEEWAGDCHGASTALAALLSPEVATVRRGYYTGPVAEGSYLGGRFCQHSWVELRERLGGETIVMDPTRFAFTGGLTWPIWVGTDDDYDIGGCRTAGRASDPPEFLDTASAPVELNLPSVEYLVGLLGQGELDYGVDQNDPWIMVSVEQLYWLANLPIKDSASPGGLARWFAAEVFEAIIRAGHSAAIPIDRRDWILPECSEGRSSF